MELTGFEIGLMIVVAAVALYYGFRRLAAYRDETQKSAVFEDYFGVPLPTSEAERSQTESLIARELIRRRGEFLIQKALAQALAEEYEKAETNSVEAILRRTHLRIQKADEESAQHCKWNEHFYASSHATDAGFGYLVAEIDGMLPEEVLAIHQPGKPHTVIGHSAANPT